MTFGLQPIHSARRWIGPPHLAMFDLQKDFQKDFLPCPLEISLAVPAKLSSPSHRVNTIRGKFFLSTIPTSVTNSSFSHLEVHELLPIQGYLDHKHVQHVIVVIVRNVLKIPLFSPNFS